MSAVPPVHISELQAFADRLGFPIGSHVQSVTSTAQSVTVVTLAHDENGHPILDGEEFATRKHVIPVVRGDLGEL